MYRSQFMPQADVVGSIRFFPPLGTNYITPDGQEWLKTGLAKDKTNYPVAALTQACQVVGNPAPTYAGGDIAASATNGAGIIVVVPSTGAGTNVWVSTDYGATWSVVAHNLPVTATGIAYNGTTWVIVGNNASSLYVSTSTAPTTTWTSAGAVASIMGGGASTDTASVCWDGTNAKWLAIAAGSSTSNAAAYSSNGTAWTAVNIAAALSGRTSIATSGGTTLAGCYSSGVIQKSTNGTSWTNATSTETNAGNIVNASGKFFRVVSQIHLTYSTDGSTWKNYAPTDVTFAISDGSRQVICSDGATMYALGAGSKYILTTTDGISFKIKGVNWNLGYGTSIASGGVNKVFAYGASTTNIYTVNMNSCDYVGTSVTSYQHAVTYSNSMLIAYMRIK